MYKIEKEKKDQMEEITKWGVPSNIIQLQRDYIDKILKACPGKLKKTQKNKE